MSVEVKVVHPNFSNHVPNLSLLLTHKRYIVLYLTSYSSILRQPKLAWHQFCFSCQYKHQAARRDILHFLFAAPTQLISRETVENAHSVCTRWTRLQFSVFECGLLTHFLQATINKHWVLKL